jgi:hypothetical protein
MKATLRAGRSVQLLLCFATTIVLSACSLLTDLGLDVSPPANPIFSDVERIDLVLPTTSANGSTSFQFDAPSEVANIVIGVFSSPILVNGDRIVNEGAFQFGSRSGLAGFSRSAVRASDFYGYNLATHDFDTSVPFAAVPSTGLRYWAVWGYDKWGNLTHASPQWSVTFP